MLANVDKRDDIMKLMNVKIKIDHGIKFRINER